MGLGRLATARTTCGGHHSSHLHTSTMSAPPRNPMAGPGRLPSSRPPGMASIERSQGRLRPAHFSDPFKSVRYTPAEHPSLSAYQTATSAPRRPPMPAEQHSSESNASSSENAEKWFQNSNRNATSSVDPAFLDSTSSARLTTSPC